MAHAATYVALAGADAMRDPNAVYDEMSRADFQKMTPHIDWAGYFKAQGAPTFTEVNVRRPAYFEAVDSLLATEPVDTWRASMRYHAIDGAAGALSSAFVNEAFRFGALRERITSLTWMSDSTKTQALAKLAAFTPKIGYPGTWRDDSALAVQDGPYLQNLKRVQDFNRARNWAKLGRPIDKTEWGMTPPTVNAYYNPSWNEIVFPAGILQAPF